ncbi:MAG: 50S ribosomal protein L25 [Polyangiaceae bacterium]|nr:50S ribosomal protein L25 [Polyangiaceae bacterium]MCW5791631.1 50S ribosomal protein L25 [Polyangiaceae bacterium]
MEAAKLTAKVRTDRGKGAARRLRRTDEIPAIIYGRGEPQAVSVSPKALRDILLSKRGKNSLIELSVEGGETYSTLIAEYQYHPVSRALLHADFRRIDLAQPIDVAVPFEVKGRAKGVVLGGDLRQVYRELPIRCVPALVPEKIVHDVTELGLEEAVTVKDLSIPEGVEVRMGENRTVVTVVASRRAKAEAEEAAKA